MRRQHRHRIRFGWERLEARTVLSTLIALIDSGVDLTDTDASPYYDFTYAYDAYNKRTAAEYGNGVVQDTSGQHGHGSTVTDLIVQGISDAKAQTGAGTTDVKIMPIRDTSSNLSIDPSAMIRGVYWAADHGADVINLSFRKYYGDFYLNDPGDPLNGSSLSQAIQYAQSHGAVVVTAPGNEQIDINRPNTYVMPAAADDPSYNGLGVALGNVLVAAAVDPSDNLTSVSNWGPIHVDVGAYTNSEGVTSYSAGYASGVTGVIAALTPSWTAAQRVDHIKQTVQPSSGLVGKVVTGGVISPANAVSSLVASAGSVAINAGGGASGSFGADSGSSGGNIGGPTPQSISTAGVVDPAPQDVYKTERWTGSSFTYTVGNLTANAAYTVRLHFAEIYYGVSPTPGGVGSREFDVSINGTQILDDYDIYKEAGGALKAVDRLFVANADSSGSVSIVFTNVLGGAKVSGIEVTPITNAAVSINAGGTASGSFAADSGYSGGSSSATGAAIATGGVVNPAPQQVYQSERWSGSSFTYSANNLTANATYVVRLHFAEIYYGTPNVPGGVGTRKFDVSSNGTLKLDDYDIFKEAGGALKAVDRLFLATADSAGTIALTFTHVTGGAKVSGIEISPATISRVAINAGGSASGSFGADSGSSGGNVGGPTSQSISTVGVVDPAPQDVYNTDRWSATSFSYTIGGLAPGAIYDVRLHFAEIYFGTPGVSGGVGSRKFDVSANGALMLDDFDIYATAGGAYKAVVRRFSIAADASGFITLTFTNVVGGAKVSGIEITRL